MYERKNAEKGRLDFPCAAITGWAAIAVTTAFAFGCGSGTPESKDACSGWTCSGHGKCRVGYWGPACECDSGYVVSEDGKECIASGPCRDVGCSGHGTCQVDGQGNPYCECEEGYSRGQDLTCLPSCTSDTDCDEPYGPTCTEDGTLATYSLPGKCQGGVCNYQVHEQDCGPLGCCTDHCCEFKPTNSDQVGRLEETGISKTVSSATFDTSNDCNEDSLLGNCELKDRKGLPNICVCKLDSLVVNGTLRLQGDALLAVLAYSSIEVRGTIDLSGSGASSGAGSSRFPRPEANTWYGGSGGSFGGKGGNVSQDSYEPRGNDRLEPLLGGEDGQDGCGGRKGGGGGGGIQLSAGESIEISGVIDAGGGGGQGGNARTDAAEDKDCIGGAGGGSGGAILLEALTVSVTGKLAANGGGGGGGGNNDGEAGGSGSDAGTGTDPAPGGQGRDGHGCALQGNTQGGDGGMGGAGEQVNGTDGESYEWKQCPDHQNYLGGGGGGGSAGRIRINTKGACKCEGSCSPKPSCGIPVGA